MSIYSEKIIGSKKISDFGGGDGPSNSFFERASTFCDLLLIDQVKIFSLSHMTTLIVLDHSSFIKIVSRQVRTQGHTEFKYKFYFPFQKVHFAVRYIHMILVLSSSLTGQWMIDELNEDF